MRAGSPRFSASRSSICPSTMPRPPAACASTRVSSARTPGSAVGLRAPRSRRRASAARRRRGSPSTRRTPCAQWAGRAACRHCPSTAGRRARANSNARTRTPRPHRAPHPGATPNSPALSMTRNGRKRLPPPSSAWRMAAPRRPPSSGPHSPSKSVRRCSVRPAAAPSLCTNVISDYLVASGQPAQAFWQRAIKRCGYSTQATQAQYGKVRSSTAGRCRCGRGKTPSPQKPAAEGEAVPAPENAAPTPQPESDPFAEAEPEAIERTHFEDLERETTQPVRRYGFEPGQPARHHARRLRPRRRLRGAVPNACAVPHRNSAAGADARSDHRGAVRSRGRIRCRRPAGRCRARKRAEHEPKRRLLSILPLTSRRTRAARSRSASKSPRRTSASIVERAGRRGRIFGRGRAATCASGAAPCVRADAVRQCRRRSQADRPRPRCTHTNRLLLLEPAPIEPEPTAPVTYEPPYAEPVAPQPEPSPSRSPSPAPARATCFRAAGRRARPRRALAA